MQYELGMDKNGMVYKVDGKTFEGESVLPTKEDFDKAHAAIDEIIKLADEESSVEKILFKIGRILNAAGYVPGYIVGILLWDFHGLTSEYNNSPGSVLDNATKGYNEGKRRLLDAQKKLEDYTQKVNKYASDRK